MQKAHDSDNIVRIRRMNMEGLKPIMIELKMNRIIKSNEFPVEFLPQTRPSSQKQPPKKSQAALPRSAGGIFPCVSSEGDEDGVGVEFALVAP